MQWNGIFTMHGWMWIFWLLVVIPVVAVVIWLVRAASGAPGHPHDETPEEILKKRLARGEIDEAEYERRLKQLRR